MEAALVDVRIVDVDCPPYPLGASAVQPATGPWSGGNVVTITGSGFQLGVTSAPYGEHVAGGRAADSEHPGSATLPQAYVYRVPMRTQ